MGLGIWTTYLGEVKVRAHQKVWFNYRPGQVELLCQRSSILNIQQPKYTTLDSRSPRGGVSSPGAQNMSVMNGQIIEIILENKSNTP